MPDSGRLGPFACREDNGQYFAVSQVLELGLDGTYTYRSNRNPDLRETGTLTYDPATGQVAFTGGRLQGRSGQIQADGRFYAAGLGYCDIYEGKLPF